MTRPTWSATAMRVAGLAILILLPTLSGCLQGAPTTAPDGDPVPDAPLPLFPAAFDDPRTILAAQPSTTIGVAGEPNLAVGPDGTRYVGVLGCPDAPSLGVEELAACRHGLVYRSHDGQDWELLNQGSDRHLGDGPFANGDTDVAVTPDGTVHVLLLGSGTIHLHRSPDGGNTWTYEGTLANDGADRPWLQTSPNGSLLATWRRGDVVEVRTSTDGTHWSATHALNATIYRQGAPRWGPACSCFLMPAFTVEGSGGLVGGDTDLGTLRVELFQSPDGEAWNTTGPLDDFPLGPTGFTTGDATYLMPTAAQANDGHTVVAWSRGVGPEQGVRTAARLFVAETHDGTWSPPRDVTPEESAVLPALAAGSEVVLAFYSSPVPGDPERVGFWSLQATSLTRDETIVVQENVHAGGICARGAYCPLVAGDRSLFDFIEAETLPDGRVAVTYTADPPTEGKTAAIHYAEQSR